MRRRAVRSPRPDRPIRWATTRALGPALVLPALLPACTPCPFDQVDLPSAPISDDAGVASLLDAVRGPTFPDLDGVTIGVEPIDDLQFFRAWTELDTLSEDDGRARTYTVQYDPLVLADPPEPAALAAVLVHELGHVHDYVAMNSDELLTFAGWYGAQDPLTSDELRDYERATDEQALARGCGDALATMRDWIYAHSEGDVLADKQRNYYGPEEIAAWMDENGRCVR